MPEYLAPGVYVEEVEMGGKPIEGVSTSTAGFIGETERGPIETRLVTGFESFRRLYGGYLSSSFLPFSVEGFFTNGGKRAFICRVTGKESCPASFGSGSGPSQKVETLFELDAAPAILADLDGKKMPAALKEKFNQNNISPSASTKPEVKTAGSNWMIKAGGTEYFITASGNKLEITTKTEVAASSEEVFEIKALGPGSWGNRIFIKLEDAKLCELKGLSPEYADYFKLTVVYWRTTIPQGWENAFPNTKIEPVVEVYDNLSSKAESPDFYEKKINNASSLINITMQKPGNPAKQSSFTALTGGSDGKKVSLENYNGTSKPGTSTGLAALKEVDEISMLCAPSENSVQGLTGAIVAHCELMKDRFAILQANQSEAPEGLLPPKDSKYAAFYYPWIKVIDPQEGRPKLIPPGGHIAGVYARSDIERGVHKAPANEVVRGVVGLEFPISKGVQDILNPRGVNCIRAFTGRGIRVWGARTVSSDPLWKYVNIRRLFLFLEESIDEGTQWVVFEPNDQNLWARVRQSVTDFLTRVWRDGALMGNTPQEAFFVKCDETTMTQDDLDNGRLIILIGVAPVKPAEFVIFRIAQWRRTDS